jgi:hypothetical protein
MIDISKYEGHTEGPWRPYKLSGQMWYTIGNLQVDWKEPDKQLIADAPLLLEEVKRLREIEWEWSVMWASLENLNLVADIRENMALHGFVFMGEEE